VSVLRVKAGAASPGWRRTGSTEFVINAP